MKRTEKLDSLKYGVRVALVAECAATISRAFSYDTEAQKDSFLSSVVLEVERQGEAITEAIKRSRVTSTLEEMDSKRDMLLKNLYSIAEGLYAMPVPSVQTLVAPVKGVLGNYSRAQIANAPYTEESTLIKSLLQDLDTVSENVKGLLGLGEVVEALRAAQFDFDAAVDAYEKALGEKKASASSLKKPLIRLINEKIVSYLSLQRLTGNKTLSSFASVVDAAIERANASSQKKNGKNDIAEFQQE